MAISACRLMDTIEASHSVTFVLPVRTLNGVCEKKKIRRQLLTLLHRSFWLSLIACVYKSPYIGE